MGMGRGKYRIALERRRALVYRIVHFFFLGAIAHALHTKALFRTKWSPSEIANRGQCNHTVRVG